MFQAAFLPVNIVDFFIFIHYKNDAAFHLHPPAASALTAAHPSQQNAAMVAYSKILPQTPWTAKHQWSLQPLPLLMITLSLVLFGIGEGMLVHARLGSTPWMVLSQGLAQQSGLNVGLTTFIISVLVLLAWLPLRMRPGLGTLLNMLVIAAVVGLFVVYIPPPVAWMARLLWCAAGIVIIGIAAALYMTCHLGTGPRDGLMIGLCQVSGWSVGTVGTLIQISVCLTGWLMGGTVGIGTLMVALCLGWVVQFALFVLRHCFAGRQPEASI